MLKKAKNQSNFRLPLLISLVLHGLLISGLLISIPQTSYRWHTQVSHTTNKPVVKATVMDQVKLSQQIKQIRWEQKAKERAEERHLKKMEHKAAALTKKRTLEQQRLRKLQQKQAESIKHQEALERDSRARVQHLKKQAEELHKQALTAKQMHMQEQTLAKRLQEEQASLEQHKKALMEQRNKQLQGVLDKYRAKILQVVQDNWHPLVQNDKLYCQMLVHLAPGGLVTKVDLLRASGDAALDRSARLAIIKSSPLPVPEDPALFDSFREVRIKMTPQEVKGLS